MIEDNCVHYIFPCVWQKLEWGQRLPNQAVSPECRSMPYVPAGQPVNYVNNQGKLVI